MSTKITNKLISAHRDWWTETTKLQAKLQDDSVGVDKQAYDFFVKRIRDINIEWGYGNADLSNKEIDELFGLKPLKESVESNFSMKLNIDGKELIIYKINGKDVEEFKIPKFGEIEFKIFDGVEIGEVKGTTLNKVKEAILRGSNKLKLPIRAMISKGEITVENA
jgi:hypothetical protein